jgi:hypothetical protein
LVSFVELRPTEHFRIAYERRLGTRGEGLARCLRQLCEADYQRVRAWFGGITPPGLPFVCHLVSGEDGAWHTGCHGTEIFLDAFDRTATDPRAIAWGNVAEIVEVFSAALGSNWDCGASNGEALSRVLATECYPGNLDGYETAVDWLNSTRQNWVDRNDPSDLRRTSTGCAALFLNYLRYQFGFSWRDVVTRGQPTLAATHRVLTGSRSGGWPGFKRLVDAHYPPGRRYDLKVDNVFPLHRRTTAR